MTLEIAGLALVLTLAPPGSDSETAAGQAAAEAMEGLGEDHRTGAPDFECRRDGSTPEVNACYAADLQAETDRMEHYLSAARTRARARDLRSGDFGESTRRLAYLDAAQTAWEPYASTVCDGVSDAAGRGTIRTLLYLSCRIEMTRERTRVIWRDYLTYGDSTPPILPEPTEPASAGDLPTSEAGPD